MTTDMIPATTQTTDEKRGLALLKAIGLDRVAPEQREIALAIADRYDLDLMLKHLVLIEGKPYVTRDGLLHIAHRSGVFDGIEVSVPEKVDRYWRATASVWRKGFSRPFTYPGRYPVGAKNDEEMCIKVAESMALRRAFDISAPTLDERWSSEDDETVTAAETVKPASLAEIARARASATSADPVVVVVTPAQEAPGAIEDPDPVSEPAPAESAATQPALCGHQAGEGLMAGAVCILPAEHNGVHKAHDGSWPR